MHDEAARARIQTICLMILATTAIMYAIYWLRPVLVPFVIAVFVVSGIAPVLDMLQRRLRVNRLVAAGIAFVAGLLVLLLLALKAGQDRGRLTPEQVAGHLATLRTLPGLVARALDRLPPELSAMLDNVVVVVEDEPSDEELRDVGIDPDDPDRDELFGLYQGTPRTERDSMFLPELPDRVVIYRGPISRCCASRAEMVQEIRDTVVHEIGHHFGLSDEEMPY